MYSIVYNKRKNKINTPVSCQKLTPPRSLSQMPLKNQGLGILYSAFISGFHQWRLMHKHAHIKYTKKYNYKQMIKSIVQKLLHIAYHRCTNVIVIHCALLIGWGLCVYLH